MSSFKKFDTKTAANTGVKVVIVGPDGEESQDWLIILGLDSDAYAKASQAFREKLLAYLTANGGPEKCKGTPAYLELIADSDKDLKAALVATWSFDEECNRENVRALFDCAPYVAAQVEAKSGERVRFATNWLASCEPTPPMNSTSPQESTPPVQPLSGSICNRLSEPPSDAPQVSTAPVAPTS